MSMLLLSIANEELEHWEFMVREDVRIACTHISDVEGNGGTFSGEWDEEDAPDGHNRLFDRLTICSRWAAQLERGETCFEVADKELPAFRHILCSQMQAEGEMLGMLSEEDEPADSPLLTVAGHSRIELVDSLADQIGGLFTEVSGG
jgi:hypothetical protein